MITHLPPPKLTPDSQTDNQTITESNRREAEMTAETPTIRVEVAGQDRPKREPKPAGPTTQLTIPAKPAALATANATTIIGSAAAAIGGPVGWVVGGAAALGGAALVRRGIRRAAAARAERAAKAAGGGVGAGSGGSAGSGTGSGSGGGSGSGKAGPLGRLLGRGKKGSGAGADGSPAGHRTGSGRPAGSRPSPHPRGRGGAGSGPASRGSGRGSGLGGSSSPAAKAARKLGKAAAQQAAKASKTATDAANRARKQAEKKARDKLRKAKNGPCVQTLGPKTPKKAGATVDRPGGEPPKTAKPEHTEPLKIIKPPKLTARKGKTVAAGNGKQGAPQGASVMYEAARQFMNICASYTPKGNMEVRAEAYEFAATLGRLAEAIEFRAAANAKQNIDPALHALYRNASAAMHAIAQSMVALGPNFDALHKQLVANQLSGQNPAGWDTTNNTYK